MTDGKPVETFEKVVLSPDEIAQAITRARRLRSEAFWAAFAPKPTERRVEKAAVTWGGGFAKA